MKYGSLNLGQIEALVNRLGGDDAVKQILADEARVDVVRTTYRYLRPVRNMELDAQTRKFSPRWHFGRRGWGTEVMRMIDSAQKTIWLPGCEIGQFEVTEPATTSEILRELPEGCVFDQSEFFRRLDQLTYWYSTRLAEDGATNVFYVKSGLQTFELDVWLFGDPPDELRMTAARVYTDSEDRIGHAELYPQGTRVFSRSGI